MDETLLNQQAEVNTQANQQTQKEIFVPKPNNNMALAIFTTVCCCPPFGIVAIIMASKVNNLYYLKQYDMAQKYADDAKKWSLIGIASGLVVQIIYFVIYGAAMLANM
ncbi:MAG: CD225/dispanin family protein [Prevotella sp.]|nr:CD225/dispanin family protein [Prevotella sp.]